MTASGLNCVMHLQFEAACAHLQTYPDPDVRCFLTLFLDWFTAEDRVVQDSGEPQRRAVLRFALPALKRTATATTHPSLEDSARFFLWYLVHLLARCPDEDETVRALVAACFVSNTFLHDPAAIRARLGILSRPSLLCFALLFDGIIDELEDERNTDDGDSEHTNEYKAATVLPLHRSSAYRLGLQALRAVTDAIRAGLGMLPQQRHSGVRTRCSALCSTAEYVRTIATCLHGMGVPWPFKDLEAPWHAPLSVSRKTSPPIPPPPPIDLDRHDVEIVTPARARKRARVSTTHSSRSSKSKRVRRLSF